MQEIYIRYFLFLCLAFTLTFATGSFIAKFSGFQLKGFTHIFSVLTAGVCLQVICFSFFYTQGVTVNLALLFILVVLLIDHKRNSKTIGGSKDGGNVNSLILSLWPVFVVLLVIFSMRYFFIYHAGGPPLIPNNDTLFHANVSNYLGIAGVEGISLDYLNIIPKSRDPYHYFDLWLNAGLFRLFQLNALTCYILVVVTLLVTICWCGFMAIAENFGKPSWLTYLLSFFFLFVSGVYLPFYLKIPILENANVFTVDLFSYTKLTVIFLFMLAAVLFFINKQITSGLLTLLILPVVFISTSVGVFGALFLFLIKKYADDKNLKYLLYSGGIMLAIALFFFLFYSANETNQTIKIRNVNGGIMSLLSFSYFKTCINIVGLTGIQMIVINAPFLCILFFYGKFIKPFLNPFKNNFIFLAMAIYFISILGWAALHYIIDTVQLFSNISVVMMTCLLFVAVAWLLYQVSFKHKLIIVSVFFLVFLFKLNYIFGLSKPVYPYSNSYLSETGKLMKELNPLGVFMFEKKSYSNIFSKNPIFNIAGKHLAYYNSKAYTYSLSVFDAPVSNERPELDEQMLSRSVFYRYVENQKLNKRFYDIKTSQLEFISDFKIQYLIAEKGVVLDSSMIRIFSAVITDSLTGERFCLLDYRKINTN